MQADHADDLIPPELTVEVEPFGLDELDDFLATPAPAPDEATPDDEPAGPVASFVRDGIEDDDDAEWAMAHVAAIVANEAMLAEQTTARIARIQRHHDAAAKRLVARREFFTAALLAYARKFHERDPKRNKTLHLPSGTVRSTTSQPKVALDPSRTEDLISWVDAKYRDDKATRDALVKTTRTPMVSELRKVTEVRRIPVATAATLQCGHLVEFPLVDDDGAAVALPDEAMCIECEADPITGPPMRTVVAVEPVVEPVACDHSGVPVPGTQVAPQTTTYTVAPS